MVVLGRSLWVAVSFKRNKETLWSHGRRTDTALWQINEHNVALVETVAPQIDAHKEQQRTGAPYRTACCSLLLSLMLSNEHEEDKAILGLTMVMNVNLTRHLRGTYEAFSRGTLEAFMRQNAS